MTLGRAPVAFRRVLGLDILPGSSAEAGEPLYACAVVSDGRVVERLEGVRWGEIASLAARYGVDAVALDNVRELGGESEIAALMRSLPAGVKLVEVTRVAGEQLSVEALCAITGLCSGKPSPLETAELAAILAYQGVGSEVLVFEEETVIKVGRGRVPGQGGMSRERYKRGIELLVRRKVSEIKEALERARLDYDLFARKSGEGYAGATFVVYASREALTGLVHQERGHDLFVEIEPVRREKLEYRALGTKAREPPRPARSLIVGVDPGMTTGVAALNLRGEVVALFSRRLLGRGQLTRILYGLGYPAVVATDVEPPPSYARRLAASLGAVLFVPPRPLSVEEKRRLAEEALSGSGYKVRDSHQRDALAAAYKAYLSLREKLEEVEREAERKGLPIPLEEAKLLVIRGEPVASAVVKVARRHFGIEPRAAQPPPAGQEERASAPLAPIVERLLSENYALRRELRELREELEEKVSALHRLLRVRGSAPSSEVVKLEAKLESASRELERVKKEYEELQREFTRAVHELTGLVTGRRCAALKLSSALRLLDQGLLRPSALADPLVYVDKDLPLDLLRDTLLKLKDPARPMVVVVRGEADGLSQALPLGVVPVPLSGLRSAAEWGDFLFLDREELEDLLRKACPAGEAERVKKAFEEYRRRRAAELFRRA
uniref:DUF460 domain-containing protein n=1 Tax=Thermofilum pendens TaxID=2269 RepID=A0A7C4BAL2_THEPE